VRIVPDTTLEQFNVISEVRKHFDRPAQATAYSSKSDGSHAPAAASQLNDGSQGAAYDIYVVPGGAKGAETISQNSKVQALLKAAYEEGKIVGMICAGMMSSHLHRVKDLYIKPLLSAYRLTSRADVEASKAGGYESP
jgi:putative intracellular protease/amidase